MSKKNLKEVKIEQKAFDLIEQKAKETGKTVDEVANEMVEKMEVLSEQKDECLMEAKPMSIMANIIYKLGFSPVYDVLENEFTIKNIRFKITKYRVTKKQDFTILVRISDVFGTTDIKNYMIFKFFYDSYDEKKSDDDLFKWVDIIIKSGDLHSRKLSIGSLRNKIFISDELRENNLKLTEFSTNEYVTNGYSFFEIQNMKTLNRYRFVMHFAALSSKIFVYDEGVMTFIGSYGIGSDGGICTKLCGFINKMDNI